MKKENAWFLVMFAVEFLIILIPLELATHSEFVTRTKFIVAIVGILAIMFADFWVLWSKISQVTKETRKKNKVYRNFQFMRKRKTGIEIAEELKRGWSKWEDKYLKKLEREAKK